MREATPRRTAGLQVATVLEEARLLPGLRLYSRHPCHEVSSRSHTPQCRPPYLASLWPSQVIRLRNSSRDLSRPIGRSLNHISLHDLIFPPKEGRRATTRSKGTLKGYDKAEMAQPKSGVRSLLWNRKAPPWASILLACPLLQLPHKPGWGSCLTVTGISFCTLIKIPPPVSHLTPLSNGMP